jgi:site-specific DNA-cytosine methylase
MQLTLWWTKSRRAQNVDDYETWIQGGVVPTLNSFDVGDTRATVLIIDGTRVDDVRVYEDEIAPTVISRYGTGGGNVPMIFENSEPIAFHRKQDPISGSVFPALGTTSEGMRISTTSTVRRLTPKECERLQGFPDGWTDGQADSNRYKQMGNAVAVPVVEWIVSSMIEVIG